jgi:hypothetical protein
LLIFLLFFLLTPNSYAQKITKISYGGTASSSGAYVGCVAMAEIINKAVPECRVTVVETGASIENALLLHRGSIHFGMVMADVAARAYHGIKEFQGKANPNLRILWANADQPHTVFVTEKSGIKSIYELQGKKYGCGLAGSATEAMTIALFEACGIRPDWFRGDTGTSRDAVKNRQIIGYVKSGAPDPSVQDVISAVPIRLLPISDADFAKAQAKYPGMFSRGTIPANIYGKGIPPEEIPTFTVIGMDLATKELPADLVYKMAKAMFDARNEYVKIYKPSAKVFPEFPASTVSRASIPLHAGIVKLCKEMGIKVPDKIIPQEYKD